MFSPYLHNFPLYFLIFSLSFIYASCVKDKAINEEKFIKIYIDLVIAQDTLKANRQDSVDFKSEVFSRYNIIREEYEATIEYYSEEPGRWEKFFNKVLKHLENLKNEKGG